LDGSGRRRIADALSASFVSVGQSTSRSGSATNQYSVRGVVSTP
jgi:hypothetical protein